MANKSGSGGDGSAAAPINFPLVVRFGKGMGYVMIAVGLFWAIASVVVGRGAPIGGLLGGGVILAVGVMQASGRDYVVIQPSSVTVKSQFGTTTKSVPINGIKDLQVSGKKLFRRSDGKKIVKLAAFGTDRDDAAAVTAALTNAAAGPTSR